MAGLVRRKIAIINAFIGVLDVFFGTALAICGFIVLGLYRNLSGIGVWAGLPLVLPGLLSMVLLGTRHKLAALAVLLTSICAICLCLAHTVVTWRDTSEWNDAQTINSNLQCYDRIDRCICNSMPKALEKFFIQRCDLFTFGFELYWAMTILSLVGCVTCFFGSLMSAVAFCSDSDPVDKFYKSRGLTFPEKSYREGSRNAGYSPH